MEKVVVDVIHNPWCFIEALEEEYAKKLEEKWQIRIREFNIWEVEDNTLDSLPKHVSETIKDLRDPAKSHGLWHAGGSLFFLNGKKLDLSPALKWPQVEEILEKMAKKDTSQESTNMIKIKEMEDSYILDRCPLGASLDPIHLSEDEYPRYGERAREIRRRFFNEVRRKYGNCVLFVWDKEKIVGFLIFLPKLVARKLGLRTSPEETLIDKTLVYACMQIVPQYHKKGLGTKLVNALITWARQNGWKRIEVHSVHKGDLAANWDWGWGLPKWEKLGFRIAQKYESGFSMVLDINNKI